MGSGCLLDILSPAAWKALKYFTSFVINSGLKEGLFTCTEMFGAIFLRIIGVDLMKIAARIASVYKQV